MKKRSVRSLTLILIVFVVYLILDYVNIPTLIGLTPTKLNMDVFGVFFDTVIVLILYVISFYYIENKQIEKDANAKDTVWVLLKKTYQECLENLILLDDRVMIEKYIIPKVDGDKPDSENKVVHNLQTLPFSSFDAVMELAVSGYVEREQLADYLDIKKEYQFLVSIKITFFDLLEPQTAEQTEMFIQIQERDVKLKRKLGKLLAKENANERD